MLISVQELAKYSSRQEMREGESLPPPVRDKLKSGFYPFSHPHTLTPSHPPTLTVHGDLLSTNGVWMEEGHDKTSQTADLQDQPKGLWVM